MRKQLLTVMLVASCATVASETGTVTQKTGTVAQETPVFAADGRMKFPENYREWIFLSSGLDMSYRESSEKGHSMFDNVFAQPQAYREFLKTGTWPEGTLLVLEVRGATQKGSINQTGKFQNEDLMGVEVHVKDSQRFQDGWAFFGFGEGKQPAAQIPTAADCYSCHRNHGAVDTTFVQFYPTLLGIAKQHGTAKRETVKPGT